MEIIQNLEVKLPNGTSCKVSGNIEHTPQNGYQMVKITHKNGEPYPDNFILKSHISHVMIENHKKKYGKK